jgi:hypothetical protein
MAKEVLHVVPNGDGWAVKREGNERASSTHDTQKNAIDGARSLAATGDDIVIHRPDGSIRDRVTYSGAPINSDDENSNHDRSRNRPEPQDIWSVGTRVRWSAVFAGVVVAVAISALLTSFALAMGLSTMDKASGKTMLIATGIVWLAIMELSLFAGGYVGTRTSTRETKFEALIIGVLVWGTTATVMALGAGASMGLALNATRTVTVATADRPFYKDLGWDQDRISRYENMSNPDRVGQELNLTPEENRKYQEAQQKSNEAKAAVGNMSPQQAAWWVLVGLLLSVGAAVGGAVVGSGPEVTERMLRKANTPVVSSHTAANERVLV